ncbi:MAG: LytR C-terminal domain-containing protein [Leptospiraceae bacterium]|nr:LytR C-terminal domain-containing protein [Leptospiraceae bacterium]MDW7976494.1 LytR C-terminal domain-containing protein [Leptospiraceae bacterium]
MFKKIYKFYFIIIFLLLSCSKEDYFEKEIHLDFVVTLGNYYNFSRWIFIPEKELTLLLFFNPDSYVVKEKDILSENIRFEEYKTQSWEEKIEVFKKITQKNPNSRIHLKDQQFEQMIDFLEGLELFLIQRLQFLESDHFFLEGKSRFYSDYLKDYLVSLETYERGNYYIASQNRHFRFETFLLNFLYQLRDKRTIFEKDNQIKVLHNILKSEIHIDDLRKLFFTLASYDFLVVEFPLMVVSNHQTNEKELVLNLEKSKEVYESVVENIKTQNEIEVTLEILNASEVNRLANRLKSIIDSQKYKVMATENFPFPLEETILVNNNGNSLFIKEIRKILNIDEKRIYFYKRTREVGLSLILGKDFEMNKFIRK